MKHKLHFKPHLNDKNYNYKNSGRLARIKQGGYSLDGQNFSNHYGVIEYEYAKGTIGHHFVIGIEGKLIGFIQDHIEIVDVEPA